MDIELTPLNPLIAERAEWAENAEKRQQQQPNEILAFGARAAVAVRRANKNRAKRYAVP